MTAQFIPNNSQAFQFISLYNPAFSGVEKFDDLKFGYRYQWTGFGKYAPKFINLSYHKQLKQPLDLTYNALRVSNLSAVKPDRIPRAKRIIHGFGADLFQSSVGVVQSIGGGISYAFNYPLTNSTRLALGASALLENGKFDISEVSVRDPDEFYNYLLRSSTSQTDLNVRAGILLYHENFYLGFSYLPLVSIPLQTSDLSMEESFYRGSFQAGVSFLLNPEVALKPSVIGLLRVDNKMMIDYNIKAYIQNKVWLGITYRDIESGIAMLGFNLNEKLTVSYAFEMSLGEFKKFDDGSHALVLSARLKNLKRYKQYIW